MTTHASTWVGENLRRLRAEKGWTQEVCSEHSGVHRHTIAVIESGVRAAPDTTTLRKLAGALGVQLVDLLVQPQRTPAMKRRSGD